MYFVALRAVDIICRSYYIYGSSGDTFLVVTYSCNRCNDGCSNSPNTPHAARSSLQPSPQHVAETECTVKSSLQQHLVFLRRVMVATSKTRCDIVYGVTCGACFSVELVASFQQRMAELS